MRRDSVLYCLFAILVWTASIAAEDAAAEGGEGGGPMTKTAIDGHFRKLAGATTEAQRFVYLRQAREAIKGKTVQLSFAVTEVRPIVFQDTDMFAVEGMNADPSYVIKFYLADEATAIALNAGDRVTLRGTGFGFFYSGKNKSVTVDQAERVADPASAEDAGGEAAEEAAVETAPPEAGAADTP